MWMYYYVCMWKCMSCTGYAYMYRHPQTCMPTYDTYMHAQCDERMHRHHTHTNTRIHTYIRIHAYTDSETYAYTYTYALYTHIHKIQSKIRTHTWRYIDTHITHTPTYVHILKPFHIRIRTQTRTRTHNQTHTARTHPHTVHIRMHMHTYTYTCTYPYLRTDTPIHLRAHTDHLHIGIPATPLSCARILPAWCFRPSLPCALGHVERVDISHSGHIQRAHRDRTSAPAGRGQPRGQGQGRPTRTVGGIYGSEGGEERDSSFVWICRVCV